MLSSLNAAAAVARNPKLRNGLASLERFALLSEQQQSPTSDKCVAGWIVSRSSD